MPAKVRTPEEEERIRRIREEVYRIKNPPFHVRVWRRVKTLMSIHRWMWPAKLIRYLWLRTIGRWVFVKRRPWDTAPEAATMRFVQAHTTIPVPHVYFSLWIGKLSYLFMERVPGCDLCRYGFRNLTNEQHGTLLFQLRDYVDQLRTLPPPPGSTRICNVLGGPIYDPRLCCEYPYGPYEDETQMNLQIRHATVDEFEAWSRFSHDQLDLIRRVDARSHQIRFTHGDLATRNMIVDNGRLLAILDWESAGWFPEHWEYLKAHFSPDHNSVEQWRKDVPAFLQEYKEELEVDRLFDTGGLQIRYIFEPKAGSKTAELLHAA